MTPRFKANINYKEIVESLKFWHNDSVRRFENKFSEISKQKYVTSFAYGRTGLYALLQALEINDKEVICPSYTCIVVANAIVKSGNKPVFVSSNTKDFNMNWQKVRLAITSNTKAIISTNLFGHPVDQDEIIKIKNEHPDVLIFQDCAHSFFAGKKDNTINKFGDASFYGMNISKIITTIFGGVVATDNEHIHKKLINWKLKNSNKPKLYKTFLQFIYLVAAYFAFNKYVYPFVNYLERAGILSRLTDYYDENKIEMPRDFTDELSKIAARVGFIQLTKYNEIIKHRRIISSLYNEKLINEDKIYIPTCLEGSTYSHYVCTIDNADGFEKYMLNKGYQIGRIVNYNIVNIEIYRGYRLVGENIMKNWPKKIINLPNHNGVNTKLAVEIANNLIEFVDQEKNNN